MCSQREGEIEREASKQAGEVENVSKYCSKKFSYEIYSDYAKVMNSAVFHGAYTLTHARTNPFVIC